MKNRLVLTVFLIILLLNNLLPAQTGSTYEISHSVIASGGGSNSTGGNYRLDGTTGQSLAGTNSAGGVINLRGGFWTPDSLAPTAALVSISGRVTTPDGQGIRNVWLTLTNLGTNETTTVLSSTFGYYRFGAVPVGQNYTLTITARRFTFNPNTKLIWLTDELTEENFVSEDI